MRARKKKLAREKPSSKSKNFYGFKAAQIVKLTLDPGPTRVNAGPKKKGPNSFTTAEMCLCVCARRELRDLAREVFFCPRSEESSTDWGPFYRHSSCAELPRQVCLLFFFQGGYPPVGHTGYSSELVLESVQLGA